MAAAEYYSGAPMEPVYQSSPQQRPQYPQALPQGSPNLHSHHQYPQQPPPPYQAVVQDSRPTVHFADQNQTPQRNSFSSQAPIPVLADQQPYLPQHSPQARPSILKPIYNPQPSSPRPQLLSAPHSVQPQRQPQMYLPKPQHNPPNAQYLSPYMQQNQSQPVLGGYASDPEYHRRRRRRHSNENRNSRREDRESRDEKTRKNRSRSTNADGFLGAAGGGLIGDLIFPGLGTVGGAVAGWIGGKDYGKHRKTKEDQLERNQDRWEHRHRRDSDHRTHARGERENRSYERHKNDY